MQRELGLERVVKLASNEGPFGPFPAALEAIERAALELNRYPDGGAYRLRHALAASATASGFEEVTVCAGADAVIGYAALADARPGRRGRHRLALVPELRPRPAEARRRPGARPAARRPVRPRGDPRRGHAADEARVHRRAEQPDGHDERAAASSTTYFARVPPHVLTVVDQAYFEYIDDPDYPDAIEEYAKAGHRVLVLRTFSKIYGLAGLRVGYGIGPEDVVTAIGKVRRAFDVTSAGAGGRAREPRRAEPRSSAGALANREAMALLRERAPRARLRARRPGRRELPLRRVGRRGGR